MARRRSVTNGDRKLIIEQAHGPEASLGYRSSRVQAREGRTSTTGSGPAHQARNRLQLVRQSRESMRDNPIYKGMIEQMVARTVGNGFKLQVRGVSKTQTRLIEGLWSDWMAWPEIRGILDGPEVSRMVMRELVVAGDIPILKTTKGVIQLFESEQLEGPRRNYNGITYDAFSRPTSYFLSPWNASGTRVDTQKGRAYNAAQIIFVTNPERPSEVRGVPAAQSSFTMLDRVNDICESETIAWQLLSRFAIAIEQNEGPKRQTLRSKADPNKDASDTEGHLTTRLTELDYALIFAAEPGEKISGVERNLPSPKFEESLRAFLRLIGLPLGLPLELMLLDWTHSNYSQSRAVLEQAYEQFLQWQTKLVHFFYDSLFKWKLGQWQAATSTGVAKNPKLKAEWILPSFPWIDQVKEAQAQGTKVERGFVTHGTVCKSLNQDRDEVVAGRSVEVTEAIEVAKGIEKKAGEKVDWRMFAGMEEQKTTQAAPAEDAEQSDDDNSAKEKSDDE